MSRKARGDTIVEVLLAITIAAFGLGVSYATAQRSLDQTITAREHNQALNYIENQITDLRLRYQNDSGNFETNFGTGGNKNHFCLDDQATTPSSSNWLLTNTTNDPSTSDASPLTIPNPYSVNCQRSHAGDGVTYFIDIKTMPITTVLQSGPHTLYQIFVRWERAGGGPTNQASTYFRINGGTAGLGSPVAAIGPPPSCSNPPLPPPIAEADSAQLYALANTNGHREMTVNWSATPWVPVVGCNYTLHIVTKSSLIYLAGPDQRMFLQFCSDITPAFTTTTALENCLGPPLYSMVQLTSDISDPVSLQATFTANLGFPSATPIKYALLRHCVQWPVKFGTCQTAQNYFDGYDINVTSP